MGPDEEREFREFVAGRSAALLRTAYVLTGDVHLARDLLQTALMSTARRWAGIEGSPEAYVRTAMYRHQVNWWRSRARRPETVSAALPEQAAAGDHAADTAQRQDLFAALRALPPGQRTVVVLRYWEDRPEAEVAELLDVSVGTVRSQASKGLAKLRAAHPARTEGATR